MPFSRRTFLKLASSALAIPFLQSGPTDWLNETPLITSVREHLEQVFSGYNISLDFRRINARNDQEFHIQILAYDLFPVASCFKAWLPLYYYLNTPRENWNDAEGSPLYSTVVFSNNTQAGFVLNDVKDRVAGSKNPIEKFNDFLLLKVGMSSGMYSWDWENSPTTGYVDLRFQPSENRLVYKGGLGYRVDNVFNTTDLAHGYDVMTRGPIFARDEHLHDSLVAAANLLSIRAPDYTSPIETIFTDGYMGKDGVLPESDLPSGLGRVLDDAGVLTVDDARYILAFMSAGESEVTIRQVLSEVSTMIQIYERSSRLNSSQGG